MPNQKSLWMGLVCALSLFTTVERAEARGGFGCIAPQIGCDDSMSSCSDEVAPFVDVTSNSIQLRYRDGCRHGSTTTVYGRAGFLGGFSVVSTKDPGTNYMQWQTATHTGLEPSKTYCFYAQTIKGTSTYTSATVCKTTEPVRCGAPIIGGLGHEAFPFRNATQIDVEYHDQCSGEDSTRVYHRAGESGPFSLIKSEGYNQGGWRTASVTGLTPNTSHCFYAETTVDGHVQKSPTECTTTTAPACAAPTIGSGRLMKAPFPQVTPAAITVQFSPNCTHDIATGLYGRREADSEWSLVHMGGPSVGWREITHTGLEPDTEYCYVVASTGPDNHVQHSPEMCRRTPVAFQQPGLQVSESTSVMESFAWSAGGPVAELADGEPILYYVNILTTGDGAVPLRELGAHVESSPLFQEELVNFTSADVLVEADDGSVRRWFFGVMPGALYNRIRSDAMYAQDIEANALVDAIVFHRVPVNGARRDGNPYQLDYHYLGTQGFEYNAILPPEGDDDDVGQIQQQLFGWVANKVLTFAVGEFRDAARFVGDRIGQITKLVRGEIDLDITFVIHNTDPGFYETDSANNPIDTVMKSGWSGNELLLKGVQVRVRQGLASFTSHTDENGQVRLKIAKNLKGNVCFDLENRWVQLTRHIYIEDVCVQDLQRFSQDQAITIEVRNRLVNVMAQMSDAGEYVSQVLGHEMPRIKVLVGPVADLVSVTGRPFAPCLGRMPNLGAGAIDALLTLVNPGLAVVGAATAYDVIMVDSKLASRGVAVHEYGHTVMCSLMGPEFQAVFTQLMLQSATQDAHDQSAYLAEGFADFITSQVVGGTDYFGVSESHESEGVNYPHSGGWGVEENFTEVSDAGNTTFESQVRRVVSLLHDFFDINSGPAATNSGIHWTRAGSGALEHSPDVHVADDEPIALSGRCLPRVFQDWRSHATLWSEDTFLKSLARVAVKDGASLSTVCDVFDLHSSDDNCPGYVSSLTTTPGSDPCGVEENNSPPIGGGNTDNPFEDGPIQRN